MKLPAINPIAKTRDFIDVFGGYNHNVRIGENEFYDMENLSSDSYPLLSVREKRRPAAMLFGNNKNTACLLYRGTLYAVYQQGNNFFLVRDADGDFTGISSWESTDHTSQRTLVPMGKQLIVLPDKKIINLADDTPYFRNIENEKNSSGGVTVQPCLIDGTVLAIDYVGDVAPSNLPDGFVWLDTSVSPASLKKYYGSQATWQSYIASYVKITATNSIGSGFKEGDGIMIDGFAVEALKGLNSTAIVKAITDNLKSIVVTGNLDPMQEDDILTAEITKTASTISFYCNRNITVNHFAGKTIQISGRTYKCSGNTAADPVTVVPVIGGQPLANGDGAVFSLKVRIAVTTSTSRIYVTGENDRMDSWYAYRDDNGKIHDPVGSTVCIGSIDQRNLARIIAIGSDGPSEPFYIIVDTAFDDLPVDTPITPVIFEKPDGLFRTKLDFVDSNNQALSITVRQNEKACPTLDNQYSESYSISFNRKMPIMDFVFEAGNRLWGCRYGDNQNEEFVNEIYCSKLGDPTNWQAYEGAATDSYAASCGTEGEWTGAINYRGYPTFFKEHYIHTVYGSNPPFQIKDMEARGIQKGSSGSMAMVNEILFYKSIHGICAYSGGLPEEISSPLGNISYKNAVGCAYRGKYYIEMKDIANHPVLFVFDTSKSMWHKESAVNATQMVAGDDNVFFIAPIDTKSGIGGLFGSGEAEIGWYAESGLFGLSTPDKKYICGLNLRLMLPLGSEMFISIQYDSSGEWESIGHVIGHNIMPFTLTLRPRRCDHFKIRMHGTGDMKLYSISKTLKQGSDK